MEYVIFTGICFIIITGYHILKYRNSGYGKFEYYLNGETNDFIGWICFITIISILIASVIGFIYLGGQLISFITK